jgi:hypothetical protein
MGPYPRKTQKNLISSSLINNRNLEPILNI